MSKKVAFKLGLGALIALSTLAAPAATRAAGLCVYSYTNSHGATCTYAGTEGGCCVYTSNDGSPCHKICNTQP